MNYSHFQYPIQWTHDVVSTSIQCRANSHDIVSTLKWRRVSTEEVARNFVIWTLFKQQQSGTSSVRTHKRIIQSDCLILEVAHVKTNVQMELNRFLTSLVSYLRFIMDQQKNLKCERLVYSVVTQPAHGLVG